MKRIAVTWLVVTVGLVAAGAPDGVVASLELRWLSCAAFSPDGRYVAVGTNYAVVLYETEHWRETTRLSFPDANVFSLAFSPDGTRLAVGAMNEVRIWSVASWDLVFTIRGSWGMVSAVRFAPGNALFVGTADGALRLWELGGEASLWKKAPHTVPVREIVFSPDGSLMATAGIDRAVLWDTATWEEVASFADKAWDVAFTPDGYFLVVGSGKVLRLRDTAVGFLYGELWGHDSCAVAVAVSPDGTLLASGSLDETARLWDPESGVCVAVLEGHGAVLAEVAFSPDGSLLLTASDNGMVWVWDVASLVSGP
jgi:WD40 repeat protein